MELNLSDSTTIDKQIALLERRLAREKSARLQAEELLVEKSREIYHSNIKLKETLAESERKRDELEFLLNSSSSISISENTENLLSHVTELSANFLHAEFAVASVQLNTAMQFDVHTPVYSSHKKWHSQKHIIQAINTVLAEHHFNNDWQVVPFNVAQSGLLDVELVIRKKVLDNESCLLSCFILSNKNYSDDTFNALTIIQRQLRTLLIARKTGQNMNAEQFDVSGIQEQLDKAKKMLMQSEKMTLLGQLSAGIAHEINNPVGFVRSNMEVLADYIQDINHFIVAQTQIVKNPDLMREIENIKQQYDIDFILDDISDIVSSNLDGVDRISEIVQGLKTFSHQGDKQFSKVDLSEVIAGALLVAKNELKYKHTIVNDTENMDLLIMGKLGQLQQVFINLFVNAAQAMPDGGEIRIKATTKDDSVCITVSDTGCGMSESTKQQLFTPFYTTKPVGEGTGLGLSISIGIIEAHSGSIDVRSEINKGTTFTLSFPIYVK